MRDFASSQVRGYEDTAPSAALTLPSGFTLPRAAKMVLHRLDDEPVEAYHFAELARLAPGVEGLMYQVTIGLEVSPPWSVMADGKFKTTNEYGPLHNRSVAHPFLLAAFHSKSIGEQ